MIIHHLHLQQTGFNDYKICAQLDTKMRGLSMPTWYLYLIRTRNGSLYTGIATDVARRLAEHQGEGRKCARYLRGRGPLQLVFKRKIGSRSLALKAESFIKRLPKHQKEEIVRSNPGTKELIAMLCII
jgi:putative endonuclease